MAFASEFVLDEAGLHRLFSTENLPLSNEIVRQGERVADESRAQVSVPWPGGYSDGPFPFARSFNLRDSIFVTHPFDTPAGPTVNVCNDAEHRGYNYPNQYLRLERKFLLVDLEALGEG